MADSEQTYAAPNGNASSGLSDAFLTFESAGKPDNMEPASKVLTWEGEDTTITYRATAAHLEVRDDAGKLQGKMFSLAYVALDESGEPMANRPVTFCYNGGPGCASIAINFGGIGPKHAQTDGTNHLKANAVIEDNPRSLLKQSDLVFLDALGTGFSMLAEDADTSKFFGVDGDADAFARAITYWLETEGRWSSPVYLYGESYGTIRDAELMFQLADHGVKLTGVTMLSAILNWAQTLPGEDLYYLGMLPTYAATAQFFGKAGQGVDVDEWFDKALAWTEDVLAPALIKCDKLSKDDEARIAQEMSELIGLDAKFLMRKHLRVELDEFRKGILADEGKVCGRLDTRFVSDAPSFMQTSDAWFAAEDASGDATAAVWSHAFRQHVHDLGFNAPARYLDMNYYRVGVSWNWKHEAAGTGAKVGTANFAVDMATALRRDPTMKLMLIGGRYDAATTYWNMIHEFDRMFLSDDLKKRIVTHRFGCGHMAYVDEPTLHAMAKAHEDFYNMD